MAAINYIALFLLASTVILMVLVVYAERLIRQLDAKADKLTNEMYTHKKSATIAKAEATRRINAMKDSWFNYGWDEALVKYQRYIDQADADVRLHRDQFSRQREINTALYKALVENLSPAAVERIRAQVAGMSGKQTVTTAPQRKDSGGWYAHEEEDWRGD